MGRLVFDNLKKVTLYLMPVSHRRIPTDVLKFTCSLKVGSYTEFMGVLANVLMGMQIPLSSYLQVCFSITNDVVMSISLMYEKAEADLMLRKPRNARTDRLTDWRLFVQIYLVSNCTRSKSTDLLPTSSSGSWPGPVAWPCGSYTWTRMASNSTTSS